MEINLDTFKELENNGNNKREKSSIDDLIDLVGDSIIEYK